MIDLALVGIGAGAPGHLTLDGIAALNRADVVLVPDKGAEKGELAAVRLRLCAAVLTNPATRIVTVAVPRRAADDPDYAGAVDRWHDAVAAAWGAAIAAALPDGGRVATMVWGDPALYDSTLRIAGRLKATIDLAVTVIPGITALQALTAAHRIPLAEIGAPVLVTTGRRLAERGWPADADTVAVMLDGASAFRALDPADLRIWWGAYLGMPAEILVAGPLAEVAHEILARRTAARAANGWIMDTYLLRRTAAG
ncbi:precorrin-6A synthase (deacetylating) [Oharaeibacter diazotrophicus]|uniref:Precorrin-6A synthase [deacetylating] n=1 Tax=Oharaeibacter diazotrophicus TaxID=1920512 RepID=A0A4R6RGL1_9HYPH|nr:precorrin-6A synthase (deacetylating) [Oharaeibacter diazotrophicus]TDP85493.1 precorrin-6A synthase (deacetylating) [Oharaeibacter diazotrophicus]BBE74463.1 precorrin 6A synthase [Pleomorphomonas sp. SM30]GLS75841.1 precorrin-6A synthase (deacetylating) [Oharaeibacter diazotrophicus]